MLPPVTRSFHPTYVLRDAALRLSPPQNRAQRWRSLPRRSAPRRRPTAQPQPGTYGSFGRREWAFRRQRQHSQLRPRPQLHKARRMEPVELPTPANHQDFERLCADVYEARLRPTRQVQRLGRSGQKQHGLDFVVSVGDLRHGFQCKRVAALSPTAVEGELSKVARYPNRLDSYTVLTTAKPDVAVQSREFTVVVRGRTLQVDIVWWEKLSAQIQEDLHVLKRYYPTFFPGLDVLHGSLIARVLRDLPSLSVNVAVGNRGTAVSLEGGLGPVHLEFTQPGGEALVRQAFRRGGGVTLKGSALRVRFHDAIERLLKDLGMGTTTGAVGTVTLRHQFEGASFPVDIVVVDKKAYPDAKAFMEEGQFAPGALRGTMTIRRMGTAEFELGVTAAAIPVEFVLRHEAGAHATAIDFTFHHGGTNLPAILAAEDFLDRLQQPSYFGVFSPEGALLDGGELPGGLVPERYPREVIELVRCLARIVGRPVTLPIEWSRSEVDEARALRDLFQRGRARRGALTFGLTVRDDAVASLNRMLESPGPWILQVPREPRTVRVFGVDVPVPATVVEASHTMVPADSVTALRRAAGPDGIRIKVRSATGAVVEEWLPDRYVPPDQRNDGGRPAVPT